MKVQNMRKKLKEVVETVPRSNKDVIALYKEKFPPKLKPIAPIKSESIIKLVAPSEYTYIGGGTSAPAITNFMGKQVFILGELTKVTDPEVLAKIRNNPTFRKGKVSAEEIYEANEKVAKIAQEQADENVKLQIFMDRQNKG